MDASNIQHDIQKVKDEIATQVKDAIAAGNKRHVSLNATTIVTIVLFVTLFGFLYVDKVKREAAQMAQYQTLMQDYKTLEAARLSDQKSHYEERLLDKQVIIDAQARQLERNRKADEKKTDVLNPANSTEKVQSDSLAILGIKPNLEVNGRLSFQQPEVQTIIGFKVDRDRFEGNFKDKVVEVDSLTSSNKSLETDLAACNTSVATLTENNKKLEKIKNPSKARRVIENIASFVAGVFVKGLLK
jgi:hypothetical protein